MGKTFIFSLLCSVYVFATANIEGLWLVMDDKNKTKPGCVVSIYEYDGKYYGRIIGIYDDDKPNDFLGTIDNPTKKAKGLKNEPYYSGLDLLWDLTPRGSKYTGYIVDPRPPRGSVYKAEVWRQGKDLIVRGKLLIFGRNQTWYPMDKDQLPKGFVVPDASKFVPSIPQPK